MPRVGIEGTLSQRVRGMGTRRARYAGLQKTRVQHVLTAVAIALYDVGLIAGLLFSLALPGAGVYGPTFGLLASACLQVGVLLPALRRQGVRNSFL